MKLVSACLLGVNCKYNGGNNSQKDLIELYQKGELIPVCPEQLGGLPTPRDPSESNGTGYDVLDGKAFVKTKGGGDVTSNFIRGAEETLKLAQLVCANEAILRSKSPSCGCNRIYDGTFTGNLTDGDGVTAALLKRNNIKVSNR